MKPVTFSDTVEYLRVNAEVADDRVARALLQRLTRLAKWTSTTKYGEASIEVAALLTGRRVK